VNIDKNRFLLLTSTLAATSLAIAATQVACQTTTTETTKTDASTPTADSGPPTEGIDLDGGTRDAAPTCLGDEGAPPLCGPVGEGLADAGDGGTSACPYECSQFGTAFKPAVARALSACLDRQLQLPTTEGCGAATVPCATEVLAQACDDPTAATFCTTWLASCDDAGANPSQSECVTLVRATTAAARTQLTTCTTEGTGCGACLEQVRNAF